MNRSLSTTDSAPSGKQPAGRNPWLTIALIIGLGLVFGASCSQKSPSLTRVTVAGETSVKAEPDAAVVVLSVITQNSQALNAQQENARKSEAVIQALKAAAAQADPARMWSMPISKSSMTTKRRAERF